MPSNYFLPAQQAELQRLGFEIKKIEPGSLIIATGRLFYWDYFLHSSKYTVFIRQVENLSAQVLEHDRARFETLEETVHPKSWSYFGRKRHRLLVVYLSNIVNTDVQQLCEKSKDVRILKRAYFVGVRDLTTNNKIVAKSHPGIGNIYYGKAYHLIHRLLDPLNTPVKRPFSTWAALLSLVLSPWVILFQFLLLFGFFLELGNFVMGIFSWF